MAAAAADHLQCVSFLLAAQWWQVDNAGENVDARTAPTRTTGQPAHIQHGHAIGVVETCRHLERFEAAWPCQGDASWVTKPAHVQGVGNTLTSAEEIVAVVVAVVGAAVVATRGGSVTVVIVVVVVVVVMLACVAVIVVTKAIAVAVVAIDEAEVARGACRGDCFGLARISRNGNRHCPTQESPRRRRQRDRGERRPCQRDPLPTLQPMSTCATVELRLRVSHVVQAHDQPART